MIDEAFLEAWQREFPFTMTPEQLESARALSHFVVAPDARSVFILGGYAGTGKTTLVASLVRLLRRLERSTVLMAPTGRAAKVFTLHAATAAYTVHKVIYRQRKTDDLSSGFTLNHNRYRHTLFIVDEASMIAGQGSGFQLFGSGRLLDDLLSFVYSGEGCRVLFVGDEAQLPPVGEEESPALSREVIERYGFHVTSARLTSVMRQARESGILLNATRLRQRLVEGDVFRAPQLHVGSHSDIRRCPGSELIEALVSSYDHHGMEETIVITRSNKLAVVYNNGIRSRILGYDEGITRGDVVMVARNNYYWTSRLLSRMGQGASLPMDFIANGDIAVVRRVHSFHTFYGLHFADLTLSFPDYDDLELDVRAVLDALQAETPALPGDLAQQLFEGVMADYAEYPSRRKRIEKLREDPSYNALQLKYAYAVTCHKAQGGQWEHVFIDQGWLPEDGIDASYYRWLYTALTRATRQVELVNWPERQTLEQ